MARPTTDACTDEAAVKLYLAGSSIESVGKRLGISRGVVTRILRNQGIARRSAPILPYHVNSHAFDDLSKEGPAYWLGFLFADAGINRAYLNLASSARDVEHLRRFAAFLDCEKPIRLHTVRNQSGRAYPAAYFGISDRVLVTKLRELGIIPFRPLGLQTLATVPAATMHHFLRGWFDGDGSVLTKPQLVFAGRPEFLAAVADIFTREAGAKTVKVRVIRPNTGQLPYHGIYRCQGIADYLYRDATVFLPRKRERINAWPPAQRAKQERFCPMCGHEL